MRLTKGMVWCGRQVRTTAHRTSSGPWTPVVGGTSAGRRASSRIKVTTGTPVLTAEIASTESAFNVPRVPTGAASGGNSCPMACRHPCALASSGSSAASAPSSTDSERLMVRAVATLAMLISAPHRIGQSDGWCSDADWRQAETLRTGAQPQPARLQRTARFHATAQSSPWPAGLNRTSRARVSRPGLSLLRSRLRSSKYCVRDGGGVREDQRSRSERHGYSSRVDHAVVTAGRSRTYAFGTTEPSASRRAACRSALPQRTRLQLPVWMLG